MNILHQLLLEAEKINEISIDLIKNTDWKEFEKLIKSPKSKLNFGNWKQKRVSGGTKSWESELDGHKLSIEFYSTTDYKKSGRIRISGKTKYRIYCYIRMDNKIITELNFGTATSESESSEIKREQARNKATKWAKDVFGFNLNRYDFNF